MAQLKFRAMRARITVAAAVCLLAGGCFPRESRHIGAVDPLSNIPAIQQAATERDRNAIPALIEQLNSDDPAVRFYAIKALEQITGQTFDYRYYDPPDQRKAAIQRWRRWLQTQRQRG